MGVKEAAQMGTADVPRVTTYGVPRSDFAVPEHPAGYYQAYVSCTPLTSDREEISAAIISELGSGLYRVLSKGD